MNGSDNDPHAADTYRVFLLRLWRENSGPWHASLQAAASTTPHRFADMDTLIAFLKELALLPAAAPPPEAD